VKTRVSRKVNLGLPVPPDFDTVDLVLEDGALAILAPVDMHLRQGHCLALRHRQLMGWIVRFRHLHPPSTMAVRVDSH
jgi:hypothetical protein